MRTFTLLLILNLFLFSVATSLTAQDQQNSSLSQASNPSEPANGSIEGTVVSVSRATLVVRIGDNQFQLFTYGPRAVRPSPLAPGMRVRVTAGPQDENGTRVASNVTVLAGPETSANSSVDKGAQAAPVPEKVQEVESDIKRESRRWHLGVRAGAAFDPELFTFGVQSQIGPIFHPRVLFRPNAEFAFGEVTDLIALNLEGIYRFSNSYRGHWTPYVGAGPALNFIHQSFNQPREISFGNFDYETGFNVLAGMQSRRGTFVELKTSLWSSPGPTLRVIVGYNFWRDWRVTSFASTRTVRSMTKRNEIITSASAVLDKMFDRPLEERIRDRAYELYLQRGRKDERAMDDWLEAEMELLGNR